MSKLAYIVENEEIDKQVTVKNERNGEYHFIRVKGSKFYNAYRKVAMVINKPWYVQTHLPKALLDEWIHSGFIDKQMAK